MKSEARRFVASCVLVTLGAIVVLAAGCIGDQKQAEPTVVRIKGRVHHIRIRHNPHPDEIILDDPNDKYVTINSASTVFWHFKKCDGAVDSAVIKFDPTSPFGDTHYVFTAADMGTDAGDVTVNNPSPRDTFRYRLLIYRHGSTTPKEVDPGIIIDVGRDSDTTRSGP